MWKQMLPYAGYGKTQGIKKDGVIDIKICKKVQGKAQMSCGYISCCTVTHKISLFLAWLCVSLCVWWKEKVDEASLQGEGELKRG